MLEATLNHVKNRIITAHGYVMTRLFVKALEWLILIILTTTNDI